MEEKNKINPSKLAKAIVNTNDEMKSLWMLEKESLNEAKKTNRTNKLILTLAITNAVATISLFILLASTVVKIFW